MTEERATEMVADTAEVLTLKSEDSVEKSAVDEKKANGDKQPTKALAKHKKRPSVTFSSGTKPPSERNLNRRKVSGSSDASDRMGNRYVRLGKSNPVRDIGIFLSAIFGLFFIAFQLSDVGKSKTPKMDIRELVHLAIDAQTEEKKNVNRPLLESSTGCGLYFSDISSIPKAGMALYAGKRYEKGDVVVEAGDLVQLHESLFVSHVGLVLNHHPELANLMDGTSMEESSDQPVKAFRASRQINPGEELFLEFASHPHSVVGDDLGLYANIPLKSDYYLAEELVAVEKFYQLSSAGNMNIPHPPRSRKAGGSEALKMVKDIVAKFNPRVANLLPSHRPMLIGRYRHGSHMLYAAIENRTIQWLDINGFCVDTMEPRTENGSTGMHTKTLVEEGESIIIAPIYVKKRDELCGPDSASQCQADPGPNCLGHVNSTVLLCPLMDAAKMRQSGTPNAKFIWSRWNDMNKRAQSRDASQVIESHKIGLTLDVIATKQIPAGDEIILDVPERVAFGIPVGDDFFPQKWKISIKYEEEEDW